MELRYRRRTFGTILRIQLNINVIEASQAKTGGPQGPLHNMHHTHRGHADFLKVFPAHVWFPTVNVARRCNALAPGIRRKGMSAVPPHTQAPGFCGMGFCSGPAHDELNI